MMLRLYLRLTLIPLALFTIVLILIHAQPYDDHELRELLMPEGCPAPCFMGIRPEVTKMDEAVNILEASEWVANISETNHCWQADCTLQTYAIKWSNKAPNWFNKEQYSELLSYENGIVSGIDILANVQLHVFDFHFLKFDLGDLYVTSVGDDRYTDMLNCQAIENFYYNTGIGYMARLCSICPRSFVDVLAVPISNVFIGPQLGYGYSGEHVTNLNEVSSKLYCTKP